MGLDEFSAPGASLKDLSAAEYSRLSALWDESFDMAPGERESWLALLARSDPESARLLRALCASLDQSRERGFLETRDLVADHVGSMIDSQPGLVGTQLGSYRVIALLGHGGMGNVWLAERADGLFARQVALKLIHPALKSRITSERFAREREILASLNHPHIARLIDAGFAEDGQPYLALDYVSGTPLTSYCDERKLPIEERLKLFQQVLSAVQYAHAHLVIHRDLKPANILVTGEGQVQLLDFGIAKLLSEGQAQETELTQIGGRALTPDYAAPEQIVGAPITTGADVYSLGVMLYELLTGERPYKLKRDSRGALEQAILEVDPVPPSGAALEQSAATARRTTTKKLSSIVRGDLDTIVMKALKKSPAERYATVNAFSEDIARFLRGDPVLAQPDSLGYRALKFVRRHSMALSVTGLLLLTLAGGLAATWYEARTASRERDASRQSQSRLLTESAAHHLKDSDVAGAQSIILEVLTNPEFSRSSTRDAVSVFQDARAADAELAVLSGHAGVVVSAGYSPEGNRVITGSVDKTVRVWDARTGLQLAVLSGHDGTVFSVAYSPDGRHIVTGSGDGTVRIWDARTFVPLSVLTVHGGAVRSAAYSPDGNRIVTASDDKTARVWDARTGAQLAVLSGHGGIVRSAAYSPDGAYIITASDDKTARIWDARTAREIRSLTGHERRVTSAAYSPDGARIVTASLDKTARVWDAMNGTQLEVLPGHGDGAFDAAFSRDGTRIVTGAGDWKARIWDARTGRQLAVLFAHSGTVMSVAFSPDGERVMTASGDKTARIWETRNEAQSEILSGHTDRALSSRYSPDGTRIVTSSYDTTVRIWDALTGKQIALLPGHRSYVFSAVYSPDGTHIVSASADKTARIWDARTGAQLAVLADHDDRVFSANYSPDGTRIVTASADGKIRIWDTRTYTRLAVLSGHTDTVVSASYSPDGQRIVSASEDKTARIWDAHTGMQLAALVGHDDRVTFAVYSPDGARILTSSVDKTARIWDSLTLRELSVLSGNGDIVDACAFSPDGTRVVTVSDDTTARIWDARTGAQLAVLSGHGDIVESVAYSPDGTQIVTASDDNTARIWDARIPASLDEQIAWATAAQVGFLSRVDRVRLGLPEENGTSPGFALGSRCDRAAGAVYDPNRIAAGLAQADINADIAGSACDAEAGIRHHPARLDYEQARASLAKRDVQSARRQFEIALSEGYSAARIDLANMLLDGTAGSIDPVRAVSLYERAWRDGLTVAAFQLGHVYEVGVTAGGAGFRADTGRAWAWYRKGADAGEPNALARFGERDERAALAAGDPSKSRDLLLSAFGYYAAATERAHSQGWPEAMWREWRYRRATLARVLAREGQMSEVAQSFRAVRRQVSLPGIGLWDRIEQTLRN